MYSTCPRCRRAVNHSGPPHAPVCNALPPVEAENAKLRAALREAVVVMEKYADWPSHNADLSAAVSNARAVLSEE
jgi:hypothetical protein